MSGTNAYADEVVNVFASGGLYSTTKDMARLVEMLVGGGEFRGVRLLSTNAIEAMYAWQGTNAAVLGSDPMGRRGWGWITCRAQPGLRGTGLLEKRDSACFHAWWR